MFHQNPRRVFGASYRLGSLVSLTLPRATPTMNPRDPEAQRRSHFDLLQSRGSLGLRCSSFSMPPFPSATCVLSAAPRFPSSRLLDLRILFELRAMPTGREKHFVGGHSRGLNAPYAARPWKRHVAGHIKVETAQTGRGAIGERRGHFASLQHPHRLRLDEFLVKPVVFRRIK